MITEQANDIVKVRVIEKLRERYAGIHDTVFIRSMEKARSPGDLFDILDTFPGKYPVCWDENSRRWVCSPNKMIPSSE